MALDENKDIQTKSVSDIRYQGNALDIVHGLHNQKTGCKDLQEVVSLRSLSMDMAGRKTLNTIKKTWYNHKNNFRILPIPK